MIRDKGIFLMSILNELDEKLDMSTFESRLLLQKKVFLLQCLEFPLRLNYGWYIRGPYSTELASTGFEMESLYKNVDRRTNIISPIVGNNKKIADRAKEFFSAVDKLGEDKAYWYELVSSLLFLKFYTYPTPKSKEKIFSLLEEKKANKFQKEDKDKAMKCIGQFVK